MMEGQKVVKVFCHEEENIKKFDELNPLDGADGRCYKVTVQESEGNIACCTLDCSGGML